MMSHLTLAQTVTLKEELQNLMERFNLPEHTHMTGEQVSSMLLTILEEQHQLYEPTSVHG
jgi:hypothetical protein